MEPINNMTPRAQQMLALAQSEAHRLNRNCIGSGELLLGLLRLGQGTAIQVLTQMGVNLETLQVTVCRLLPDFVNLPPPEKLSTYIPFTPLFRKIVDGAQKEARLLSHTYIGTEHLVLGILGIDTEQNTALHAFQAVGVDQSLYRDKLLKQLDPSYQGSGPAAVKKMLDDQVSLSNNLGQQLTPFGKLDAVFVTIGEKKIIIDPTLAASIIVLGQQNRVVTTTGLIELLTSIRKTS